MSQTYNYTVRRKEYLEVLNEKGLALQSFDSLSMLAVLEGLTQRNKCNKSSPDLRRNKACGAFLREGRTLDFSAGDTAVGARSWIFILKHNAQNQTHVVS